MLKTARFARLPTNARRLVVVHFDCWVPLLAYPVNKAFLHEWASWGLTSFDTQPPQSLTSFETASSNEAVFREGDLRLDGALTTA